MTIELLYPRPELRTATPRQRDAFHRDGYLVLPGVLERSRGRAARRRPSTGSTGARTSTAPNPDPARRMDFMPVLEEGPEFVELIDHERTFGFVLDLLGPYIQFGLSTVTVHPPNPVFKGFLHVDGGPALQRIRPSETSWPLQVKIIWFLTDVTAPDMGNIVFVPGSHLRPFPGGGRPGRVRRAAGRDDAGHDAGHGDGRRRADLHARPLARRRREPLERDPQEHPVRLQPDVLPELRLRRAGPRVRARVRHAPPATAPRRLRARTRGPATPSTRRATTCG